MILKNKISPSANIGIWKIDETQNVFLLPEKEKKEIISVKSISRRNEIIATKLLVKELQSESAELFYDENGKPHLNNPERHISLSHSYEYVAAIIESRHETGIDIQKITPKIFRIKEKFMSEKELKAISENENLIDKLHVFWGAKECVFKAYGKGSLIFSENIFVEPFDFKNTGEFISHLKLQHQKKSFRLRYEKLNDYMLVYIRDLFNIVK